MSQYLKILVFCIAWGVTAGAGFAAWAQGTVIAPAANDTLILNKNHQESVISGSVTDVRGDTIMINHDGKEVRVDIDELDIDSSVDELIEPGMTITVQGEFEDMGATPEFKAKSLVRNARATGLTSGEAELMDNDNNSDVDHLVPVTRTFPRRD